MLDKRPRLILLAAMMTAVCLALIQIDRVPLWIDEGSTFFRANFPIGRLLRELGRSEPHGPFYYLIMKAWLWLGDSEFWLRSFSALCFTLTVPVVYGIGQSISGRRAGLYAAWLTATAPFLIRYAQEARMYALLTFFCSLALMATAMLLARSSGRPPAIGAGLWRRIRGADRSKGRSQRSDDALWAIYIIGVLGGMLSHNTALMLPVITTLIFLVAIAAAPQYRWPRLRNLIIASLVILALYAPSFSILSDNIQNVSRFYTSVTKLLWEIRDILIDVYSNKHLPLQAAAMVVLFVLALWGWRRRPDWKWIGFALLGTLTLPLALQAVTLFYRTVFIPRTLIWAAIPFTVVCAVGLARLPRARLRRIALAGLLAGSLYGVSHEYQRPIHEPWGEAVQALAEIAADDAAVVLCPEWIYLSFNYYWRHHERGQVVFGSGRDLTASPFQEPIGGRVWLWGRADEPRALASLFDDYEELWIVRRRGAGSDSCDLEALQDELAGSGWLVEKRGFARDITLFAYSRDGRLLDEYTNNVHEPWDQAAQMVAETAADEAAVVLCPDWTVDFFNYFWRHYDHGADIFGGQGRFGSDDSFSGDDLTAKPFLEPASRGMVASWREMGEPRLLTSLLDDYPELWILNRQATRYSSCDLERLQDELVGRGRLLEEHRLGGIVLYIYSPDGILNDYSSNLANEPWDQAAQMVAETANDEAAVLLCPDWTVYSFNYFWRHYDHKADTFGVQDLFGGEDLMISPFLEPAASGKIASWREAGEPRLLTSLLDDYPELWILDRRGSVSASCDPKRLQNELAGRGWLLEEHRLGGLALYVYSPDGILNDYSFDLADSPWDQAARVVAEKAADEAAVLICPDWTAGSFNYFWRHYDHKADTFGGKGRGAGEYLMVNPFLVPAVSGKSASWRQTGEPRHITSLLDDYSELWIVNRRGGFDASCDLEALQSELARSGWPLEEFQIGGRLDLLAYVSADPST